MATRAAALAILLGSALLAWVAVTTPLATRVLQLAVAVSVLYVAWMAWRGGRAMRRLIADARSDAAKPTGLAAGLPRISLVLPARNEAPVIGETVAALVAQRYADPSGRPAYDLLVIDDGSTDDTGARAAASAASAAGADHVRVRRREPGSGPRTKGSVLAFAMPMVEGEVIGVIDADTRVPPSFLETVMRAWGRDPEAAAVQVGRPPRNAATSWLTRAQQVEERMDVASQCGRWASGGTAEVRGNGMFVRREALDAVGGWNERALTEDLDLATRLAASGRHVAMVPEAGVAEEAVEALGALWHQRLRWAEGSVRRLLAHGPGLVASQPMKRKLDFLSFAVEFLVPPLFLASLVAGLVTVALPRSADWTVPLTLLAGYGIGVFCLALAGLSASGEWGPRLVLRALGGTLFLAHWLLVVPVALLRIAFWPERTWFVQTPRFTGNDR
jgi:1,2-diacylglycerol 3-beta-glucosyltransferase